ncbi:MAG: EAL domain-containing protein [Candidatus Nanopelagicales bacterium]
MQTILDSLPAETVMLDGDGRILAVNGTWKRAWSLGDGGPQPEWIGMDYLEASAPSDAREHDLDGLAVRRGIESVLRGEATRYALDYECKVRDDLRWFHLHVVPISGRDGAIVTHTDITARKRAEHELSHRARHDALTGLPNRELLRERLQIELSRSRARNRLTAVAFIDLDNFKDINDAYGHVYGDLVLDAVGIRLEQAVRREDTVARIGGDEYVVLLADLDHDFDPEPYFSRVRDAVSQPVELGVAEVRPSMSIGLVLSPPHLGDVDAILRDADTAMYAAKRAGRDRWELFTPAVRDEAIGRALTTDRLSVALQEDGFVLHYQPIVHLATNRVLGAEALLRLRAPDGSLLYPGQFLAAVDSGPLAADVGAWVLDHALAQQAIWQKVDPDHATGINVSPRQLGHGRFVNEVKAGLERHGVTPEHLMLELTEDVLVASSSRAVDEIAELSALGIRFAIDDFGTGYSSLSYLNQLPVHALKIDRSFLLEAQKPGGQALMAAIVGVARAVGADTVAEGVETLEQLELVRSMGVDIAQGFLLGRPEPPLDAPRASLVDTSISHRR